MGDWDLIESDPGVFTEFIEKIGVSGVQVEEIWSLDEEVIGAIRPVYGLIFLFRYKKGTLKPSGHSMNEAETEAAGLFFANQIITNACATQALLAILANAPDIPDIGDSLRGFIEFTRDFGPKDKGEAISNSEVIRAAHNSFSRPEVFELDKSYSDEDAFHFISYIPFRGRLYELDGLQKGPIDHGAIGDDWMDAARSVLMERMARFGAEEIHFSLMAVVADRREVIKARMSETEAGSIQATELDVQLAEEIGKREGWRKANVRRRHGYVPMLFALIKLLHEKGQLEQCIEVGRERLEEERKKKAE